MVADYTVSFLVLGECFILPGVGLKLIGSSELSDTSAACSNRSFDGSRSSVLGFGALQSSQVMMQHQYCPHVKP